MCRVDLLTQMMTRVRTPMQGIYTCMCTYIHRAFEQGSVVMMPYVSSGFIDTDDDTRAAGEAYPYARYISMHVYIQTYIRTYPVSKNAHWCGL
jgi:hypothetical protein